MGTNLIHQIREIEEVLQIGAFLWTKKDVHSRTKRKEKRGVYLVVKKL